MMEGRLTGAGEVRFRAGDVKSRSKDDKREGEGALTWQKQGRGCVIVGGYKYMHILCTRREAWCSNRNHMSSREEPGEERRHGK